MPDAREMLTSAIDRNTSVAISLSGGPAFRTRLLADADGILWLGMPARGDAAVIAAYIAGQPVIVSFRSGGSVVSFSTTIVKPAASFALTAQTTVTAVGIRSPDDLEVTQRRQAFRARVPLSAAVQAEVWRIGEERAPAFMAEPRDLSIGGTTLVFLNQHRRAIRLVANHSIRLVLKAGDRRLSLTGRVLRVEKPNSTSLRAAVAFDPLIATVEARQTASQLEHWVAELQQAEAKRRAG